MSDDTDETTLTARTMSDATLHNIINNCRDKDIAVPVDILAAAVERGFTLS